jgi:hypothetical protein
LGRTTKEKNQFFGLIMNSLDLSKVYGFKSLMTSQHYLMGALGDESSKHNYLSPFSLTDLHEYEKVCFLSHLSLSHMPLSNFHFEAK